MSIIPKRYFYDKAVLLLLSILAFLVFITIVSVAIRIASGQGVTDYFVEYRSSAAQTSAFKVGDVFAMLSFVAFAILTLVVSVILSLRTYHIKREVSQLVLVFGIVLTLLAVIVSNALLALR